MFAYLDRTDKKLNVTYRDYYLTQGDTLSLKAVQKGENEPVIDTIKFKLRLSENNLIVFEQDFFEENGVFYLIVDPVDTAKWEVSTDMYKYEIEVTYNGESISTVRSANFIVWEQGLERV